MTIVWDIYESPLGPLTIEAGTRGITALSFPGRGAARDGGRRDPTALADAVAQLEEYFRGERREFDLPLDPRGTPFQERVWGQVRRLAYATTATYAQLAAAVGRPDVLRAVAAAVGRTPVPIVVPCHRVVGAGGALTGYRGGLQRKAALLDLERRTSAGLAPEPAWALRQLTLV